MQIEEWQNILLAAKTMIIMAITTPNIVNPQSNCFQYEFLDLLSFVT